MDSVQLIEEVSQNLIIAKDGLKNHLFYWGGIYTTISVLFRQLVIQVVIH
jgi:hypothetical protein